LMKAMQYGVEALEQGKWKCCTFEAILISGTI